jgi:hypothetical protein
LDETCILEREIVDRIEKEMSRRAHFLESFSQKRDEIIEYTPTFQGRQKMIKCVRSSRKDLAALERDRTKRESDRRLFSFRQSPLSHSRKLGFPRRARDRRREEEEHHHHRPKAIGSLFFLFFSL